MQRLLYPLFFIFLLAISAYTWMTNFVLLDPKDEAVSFVKDVREGSLAKTVKHFGGNACRCPAKGGWGSYLIYISGQEPNLAFMQGHPFQMGEAKDTPMHNRHTTLLPWEKPEDAAVDIPVTFDPAKYAPLFLPLQMAYGYPMKVDEFEQFLQDPDKESGRGLTLRLRPSIEPGSIAPPKQELSVEALAEFEDLRKKKSAAEKKKYDELTSDLVKTLGPEATKYLVPKDAGEVLLADGKAMPPNEVAQKLPRLKSAILRLHVVRRGKLKEWTIYHFGLMHPVLVEGDREIALQHDRPLDETPPPPPK